MSLMVIVSTFREATFVTVKRDTNLKRTVNLYAKVRVKSRQFY